MHIKGGRIEPNSNYTISATKRDSLPNYILQENDIIMGRRGEMGRCSLVTQKEIGWFCGTGSLYIRPIQEIVLSTYLFYYLSSAIVKQILTGNATGTTMMNLNKKIVSNIPIPVPHMEEQHKIVQEIESRLSVCDKIEQNIAEALEKSEALRQSILKKAFEGKLLSKVEIEKCKQKADYEPASVLLERIRKDKKK
jgi:type I restriction enzyme S subunit